MDSKVPGSLPAGAFAVKRDKNIRKFIEKIGLFEQATKELSRRRYEKYMRLNLSSGCIQCRNGAYPKLAEILENCARQFDVNIPDLYVLNSAEIRCNFIGEEKPTIILSTASLDLFNEDEMFALLSMKLSHIHCMHEPFLMAIDLLDSAADNMGILKSALVPLRTFLAEWVHIADLSCDRGALLATGDMQTVLAVQGKLAGCGITKFGGAPAEYLLEQYKNWQEIKDDTPTCPIFKAWSNLYVKLPQYALRAGILNEWSKSAEYASLSKGLMPEDTTAPHNDEPVINNWGSFAGGETAWETPELSDDIIFGAAGIEHQLRRMLDNTGDVFEKGLRQGAGIAAQAAGTLSDILGKFANK